MSASSGAEMGLIYPWAIPIDSRLMLIKYKLDTPTVCEWIRSARLTHCDVMSMHEGAPFLAHLAARGSAPLKSRRPMRFTRSSARCG